MTDRPPVLSAKVEKLIAIIEDGNDGKLNSTSPDENRRKQKEAAAELLSADGSVSDIEAVDLPSER